MVKSYVSPIYGGEDLIQEISTLLNCKVDNLPITYLGLPTNFKKAKKEDFQRLIDKIRSRHALWKMYMLTQEGRLILVQSVLSVIAISHLMSFDPPPWVFKTIDKIRRSFLWKGTDAVQGGQSSKLESRVSS
jgi:hypothetical protein